MLITFAALLLRTKTACMKNLITVGRCFYGIGVVGIAVLQFIYADLRPVIFPPGWPTALHSSVLAYTVGVALIIAGISVIFGKSIKTIGFALAAFFFILFVAFQFPYIMFIQPNSPRHLGLWTDPLKELAFCGGALIIATSALDNKAELWLIVGRVFFGFMLIAFGIDHFYYTKFVATLVPSWIPAPVFCTYVGAICLIGSGVCLILKIFIRQIALLLGTMLLIWFAILHFPRAVADPYIMQGNEITSVFEALAYSGVAFVIAGVYRRRDTNKKPHSDERGSLV